MPTYNYKCQHCSTTIERILKVADYKKPESEPCPECNVHGLRQVIYGVELNHTHTLGKVQPNEDWKSFIRELDRKNPNHSGFTTW